MDTPSITHRVDFYYTLHLESGDIPTHENELEQLYTILAGFFSGISINTANWGGFVTVDKDGEEVINGWYGSFAVADHVARSWVEKGRTKGARAYACINEYGAYKNEKPPAIEDDDEPEPEAPAPAVTLDKWGIE